MEGVDRKEGEMRKKNEGGVFTKEVDQTVME